MKACITQRPTPCTLSRSTNSHTLIIADRQFQPTLPRACVVFKAISSITGRRRNRYDDTNSEIEVQRFITISGIRLSYDFLMNHLWIVNNTWIPSDLRWSAGPMPESISSLGDARAPQLKIISLSASALHCFPKQHNKKTSLGNPGPHSSQWSLYQHRPSTASLNST